MKFSKGLKPRQTLMSRLMASAMTLGLLCAGVSASAQTPLREGLPHYQHVFVIIEENKDFDQIMGGVVAPNIAQLAKTYGLASQFYGEVHPSEGNYVALLGGDTYGIHDDDAFYCKPAMSDALCTNSARPDYKDHTVYGASLGSQLEAAGLSWKGYYEDIPAPGSLAINAGSVMDEGVAKSVPLYASKHSGFINFASVQNDAHRDQKLVGFDQFERDLAADHLPNFALIIPNQCNEMHGISAPFMPQDCRDTTALIGRGDKVVANLVQKLMATKAWQSSDNVAIVITFDEGSGGSKGGCCGTDPASAANFGGGRIPTLILTNHGPRGVNDMTPYSHYSLLRSFEDIFDLKGYLGHAADTDKGVKPLTPLFAVKP